MKTTLAFTLTCLAALLPTCTPLPTLAGRYDVSGGFITPSNVTVRGLWATNQYQPPTELQMIGDVSGTNVTSYGGDAGPLTVRGGDTPTGEAGDLVLRGGDETSMGGYGGDVLIRGGNCTAGSKAT